MIIVVGVYEVAEGDRPAFLATKAGQVAATRVEPGCLDYSFAADGVDPTRVRLLERWESLADLEAHVAGLRAGAPAPQPPVPSTMVEVAVYEASPTVPSWG